MVSVLGMPPADYPSAVLYGPPPPLPLSRPLQPPPLPQQPPQAGGNKFQQRSAAAFYARSPPQRSNSTAAAAAALHLRSQSVPEAVYLEQQQQQIGLPLVLQQRTSPTKQLRVMHYGLHGGHLHPPPPHLWAAATSRGCRFDTPAGWSLTGLDRVPARGIGVIWVMPGGGRV